MVTVSPVLFLGREDGREDEVLARAMVVVAVVVTPLAIVVL